MSIHETVRNSDNEEPIKQNLHPGVVPVEEGGERPIEGAKPLTSDIEPTVDAFPDDAASLAGPTETDTQTPIESETPTETRSERKPTPLQLLAGGILAAVAGAGIFAGLTHGHDSEKQTTKPVAASTPSNPTPTTNSTPATPSATVTATSPTALPSSVTSTPTPTETPSETAPTVAPDETPSDTEDVIPLADFEKFAKANASTKDDILKQHPEAFGFMSRPHVDSAIGEGIVTKTNITGYLKTLKTLSAEKGFTSMFDTFNSTNPDDYQWLMSAGPTDPDVIATLCDQFAYKAIAGSKGYGESYWKLTSLNPNFQKSFKEDETKQLAMGNNTDGTFTVKEFKILDAYNVALGPKEEATVLLTYKKFLPNRSGISIEHLDWVVMTHLPAGVVDTGNGNANPNQVTGLMFDQFDLTSQ